jgi:uncharacterized protein YndB with AHSA1/START domain
MMDKNRFEGDTVLIANPGEASFTITRTFHAPARLVYDAWTKPELLKRWYGTSCMQLESCEMDVRPGGAWKRVLSDKDGNRCAFYGTFLEVDPPARLTFTETFEPFPEHPSTVTVTLREQDGKTFAHLVQLHDSVASRDAHIGSGMEHGMRESLDLLEAFLSATNSRENHASP